MTVLPLSLAHIGMTERFECGNEIMDKWFQEWAIQNDDGVGITKTFVLMDEKRLGIMGFYSICAASVASDDLPLSYEIPDTYSPAIKTLPAVMLQAFGRDRKLRGSTLMVGDALLWKCLQQICDLSGSLGISVVVLQPVDAFASEWFARRGFRPFSAQCTSGERWRFATVESLKHFLKKAI